MALLLVGDAANGIIIHLARRFGRQNAMLSKLADLKFDDSVLQPMSRDRGVYIGDFLFAVFFLDRQTAKLKVG